MIGGQTILLIVYLVAMFCFNYFGVLLFARYAVEKRLFIDHPNERSTHVRERVSAAGIFFVWSSLLSCLLIELHFETGFLLGFVAGAALVATVSLVDDYRGLSIKVRLLAQFGGASVFLACLPLPAYLIDSFGVMSLLWVPAAAIFLVGVTNLYNFMDGIDGMAGAHTLLVLLGWGILNYSGASASFELLFCLAVAIPLLAFLLHNWFPARVFMGDVGSTFLGFTVGALAIMQVPALPQSNGFFALILLMMPFLFDTSCTVVTRFLSGMNWYLPHREFLFQRLVASGLSQRTVSAAYAVMTCYAWALIFFCRGGYLHSVWVVAPLFLTPYLLLYLWVSRSESGAVSDSVASAKI